MRFSPVGPRGVAAFASVLALLGAPLPLAHADELRSDEGVAVDLPDGWQRRTTRLSATTALALERSDGSEPKPTIVVNTLNIQSITEEKAFQLVREQLEKPGEIVERANGRFLKVDFDYESNGRKLKNRVYAALRNKRVYYFVIATTAENFDRDAPAFEQVMAGARFFEASQHPAPLPAPAPATAPVASPTETVKPARPPAPTRPTATQPINHETHPEAPRAERVAPPVAPAPEGPPAGTPKAAPGSPRDVTAEPTPEPTKAPEPAKAPEPTKALEPAKAPPPAPVVRRPGAENLLVATSLVAFDDEYDPEAFGARHLVDGAGSKGWCSSSAGRAPHRFVFELARTLDVFRVSFDALCTDEPGFEGATAKGVLVEGSATSARGPWKELGRAQLAPGKNDQPVDLVANESRWLRVSVLSNQGHPTLTRLLALRAFPAETAPAPPAAPTFVTTDEGPFRLERLRLSRDKGGSALEAPSFAPGDAVWIYFKPRALRLSAKGEYTLEVDLALEDAKGKEQLSRPRVLEHTAKPPRAPLSPFVSLRVDLPPDFPEGAYVLKVTARDREAAKDATERLAFEVRKAR